MAQKDRRQERIPLIDVVKLTDAEVAALPGQYIIDTLSNPPKRIKIYTDAQYRQVKAQLSEMDQAKRTHIIQRVANVRMAKLYLEYNHVMNHGQYCLESEMDQYMTRITDASRLRKLAADHIQGTPQSQIDLSEFDGNYNSKEPMKPIDLSEFDTTPAKPKKSKIPKTVNPKNPIIKSATPEKA